MKTKRAVSWLLSARVVLTVAALAALIFPVRGRAIGITKVSPSSGPPGTIAVITGADFANGASVKFGAVVSTAVVFVSATQINAVAPPHYLETVNVSVTNPDGSSATSAAAFTYSAAGLAVNSVSPTSGPPTGGTSVTILGTGFQTGAAVFFGASQAASAVVVSSTQIQAVTPPKPASTVSVTVKNPDSTTATVNSAFSFLAPVSSGSPPSPSSPPEGSQGLLTGMTPHNLTVPNGWVVARTQDFETGKLAQNESFSGGNTTISSSFAHTGTHSLVGTYNGDGAQVGWYSPNNNSREVYFSWWEFDESQGRLNDEMFLARTVNNDNSLVQDIVVDFYPGGFNSLSAPLVEMSETVSPNGVSKSIYGPNVTPGWGSWTQWEVHVKANDPGVSNGELEVYENGRLVFQLTNTNLNGNVDMTGQSVEIGGVYTKFVWYYPGTTTCATSLGYDPLSRMGSFLPPDPCPNQAPPNGFVPSFKRYIDDIIVLNR